MANSMKRPPMQKQAERLAEQGRFGDSMLVHMNPAEVEGIASLMPGGQLTINPQTGQPEAFIGALIAAATAIGGAVKGRKDRKAAQRQTDAIAAKSAPFDKFTADQLNRIASGQSSAFSPGQSYADIKDKSKIGFLPEGMSPGINFDFQNTPGTMYANYQPDNPFAMGPLPKRMTQQSVSQDQTDTDETGGTVATIPADDVGGMAPDFDQLEMINASRIEQGLPPFESIEDFYDFVSDQHEGGPDSWLGPMVANEGGLASLPQGFFGGGEADGTTEEEQARENERLLEEVSRGIFGGIGRAGRMERRANRRSMRQQRRGDRQASGGWYLGKNLGRANPSMGGANQVNYSEATRPQQSPQAPQEGGWYPGKRVKDWSDKRKAEGKWYPGKIDEAIDQGFKDRRAQRKAEGKWYLGKNLENLTSIPERLSNRTEAIDAANAYARSMGVPEAQRGGWRGRAQSWQDRVSEGNPGLNWLSGLENRQDVLGGILSLIGGYADGDMVEHFPRMNGPISGPGTERSDDIPAMLSDGEFVVNARAVRGVGKLNGANGSKSDQRREGARMMYALQNAGEQAMRRT